MVKPDFYLWNRTDPIFRVVNRFFILCLIGSRVGSGNSRVGSGFSFCSPLAKSSANSGSDLDQRPVKSRISPVKFTDEKARKLRMLTSETKSFHDVMYHPAIASRFVSYFSDRFDA
ncbi:hypothetical protein Hanom_Chr04g00367261 [Helianthus anomalus]